MTIDSLKDLEKLMKLCRAQGIESFKVDGIEFKLGSEPTPKARRQRLPNLDDITKVINPYDPTAPISDDIKTPDQLTPEQLMFYSSGEPA